MWFSEDLNPAFTTAAVVNAKNQPVDQKDAHVAAGDSKEMDISLKANLPPSVYIVIYRTDSAEDGHILRGSFIFTVANPNGSLPTLNPNTIPGQNVLSGGNPTGLYTGQLDSTPSIKRCSSALSTNGLCPRYSCSSSPTSASCWGRRLPLAVVNGEPPSHPHCLQVLSPMGALVRSGLYA